MLTINQKDREVYAYRGICQYKLHNVLPALNDFKKCESVGCAKAKLYHAKAAFKTGDIEKAKAMLIACEKDIVEAKDVCCGNNNYFKKLAKQWLKFKETSGIAKAESLIRFVAIAVYVLTIIIQILEML